LPPGSKINGPAIVEERESTTVLGPNSALVIDDHLNLIVEMNIADACAAFEAGTVLPSKVVA
jgi:hypothetical protein